MEMFSELTDGHEFLLCQRDLMREYGMAGTGSAWGDLAVSTDKLKCSGAY